MTDRTAPAKEAEAEGESRSEPLVTDDELSELLELCDRAPEPNGALWCDVGWRTSLVRSLARELQSRRSSPVREGENQERILPTGSGIVQNKKVLIEQCAVLLDARAADEYKIVEASKIADSNHWSAMGAHYALRNAARAVRALAPIGSAPPSDEGGSRPNNSSGADRDAVIETDLKALGRAIMAGDPKGELLLRVNDMLGSLKSPPTVG